MILRICLLGIMLLIVSVVTVNCYCMKDINSEKPITSEMVLIPGGTFQMGSNIAPEELPIHNVTLSPYYISKYEVTNKEYCVFLNSQGNQTEGGGPWVTAPVPASSSRYPACCGLEGGPNPGTFKVKQGYEDKPVVFMSWYGALAYCNWLSEKEGLTPCYGPKDARGDDPSVWRTKNGYRLPTEAEAEYACRGGTKTLYYWGDDVTKIDDYCWYIINSNDSIHIIGQKKPNNFGLYDISGNVWEWCNDWYQKGYPPDSVTDPTGPLKGDVRVSRGASWNNQAIACRPTIRNWDEPKLCHESIGLRLVKTKL